MEDALDLKQYSIRDGSRIIVFLFVIEMQIPEVTGYTQSDTE
jgi:hypothetical protein